jgi:hypothetical protein
MTGGWDQSPDTRHEGDKSGRLRLVPGADSATIEGVPQQSQVALQARCHWAGAGIGRIVVTFQPFGVFTKTWFMRNRVC